MWICSVDFYYSVSQHFVFQSVTTTTTSTTTTTTAKSSTVASTTMATNVRMNRKLTTLEKTIHLIRFISYTNYYFFFYNHNQQGKKCHKLTCNGDVCYQGNTNVALCTPGQNFCMVKRKRKKKDLFPYLPIEILINYNFKNHSGCRISWIMPTSNKRIMVCI